MRPLIPKVRLGDVLYGTRHLRHYLRAISVLTQLATISEYSRSNLQEIGLKLIPPLYAPRKDDPFVTAVNANGRFAVWSTNGPAVLLFVNPTASPQEVAKHLKNPYAKVAGNPLTLPVCDRIGVPRMDATIFSKWFVRTPFRQVDTAVWPRYATGLRLCFHHNLIAWGEKGVPGTALNYITTGAWTSPLNMGSANEGWNPRDLDEQESFVQQAAVRGGHHPKAFENKMTGMMQLEGLGPSLALLPGIRKEIARHYQLCVEKGTLKRTKNEAGASETHPEGDILGVLGSLGPDLLDHSALSDVAS